VLLDPLSDRVYRPIARTKVVPIRHHHPTPIGIIAHDVPSTTPARSRPQIPNR
jgi:hypothetical protein